MGLLQSEAVAGTLREPKQHRMLLLKLSHMSKLCNPKYLTRRPGEFVTIPLTWRFQEKNCLFITSR